MWLNTSVVAAGYARVHEEVVGCGYVVMSVLVNTQY